jgi:NAD(P)-dependent dehydrogenase (short-subunit alcohol dehydrogenase family)
MPMDKIILITGASRGIGAATALLAAEYGYAVCVNYVHNQAAAQQVVASIQKKGGNAVAVAADISKETEVIKLFTTLDEQLGRVTALVNNAGILQKQKRLEDMTTERLERIFATNVLGSFLCAREAIKRMSTKHGGSGGAIVNISSGAALSGAPNEYIDYAASKGAIDSFTIGLAREVAEEGIRVNAVRPGFIYTDIHASGGEPERIERVKHGVPLKRGGHPEEVAQAILWLLSDQASYTTASFIDVMGGK